MENRISPYIALTENNFIECNKFEKNCTQFLLGNKCRRKQKWKTSESVKQGEQMISHTFEFVSTLISVVMFLFFN